MSPLNDIFLVNYKKKDTMFFIKGKICKKKENIFDFFNLRTFPIFEIRLVIFSEEKNNSFFLNLNLLDVLFGKME